MFLVDIVKRLLKRYQLASRLNRTAQQASIYLFPSLLLQLQQIAVQFGKCDLGQNPRSQMIDVTSPLFDSRKYANAGSYHMHRAAFDRHNTMTAEG